MIPTGAPSTSRFKSYGETASAEPRLPESERILLKRQQTRHEELFNSVSHGIGLIAVLAGTPYLLTEVALHSDTRYLIGASIFAASMTALYLASACYHALAPGKSKRVFRAIEHSAIFLLIAGTCTPLMLGVLRGVLGWTLLGLVWSLAVVGVALKLRNRLSHPVASTALYLLMGWLIVVAVNPLYLNHSLPGLYWLIAGGIAYTAGVAFYATDSRLPYGHFIWHLFVMTGTGCHYLAILAYAR